MEDIDRLQEECTHNCSNCHGCGDGDGVGKFEKALNRFSEIDSQDLLAALQSLADADNKETGV